MSLDALTAAPAASAASPPGAATDAPAAVATDTAQSKTAIAADFETFLALLTAQMRNQDPLQPVESTEFVAQLASFSSVEQQIRTNEQLESIFDALTRGQGAGLAEWIGRDVRTSAPLRHEAGAEVEVNVAPIPGATAASLVARDLAGAEVGRMPVDPAAAAVVWSGRDADGATPAGLRRFEVEYLGEDGAALGVARGEVFRTVTEVRLAPGDPKLVLAGGSELNPDDVSGLRAAAAPDA